MSNQKEQDSTRKTGQIMGFFAVLAFILLAWLFFENSLQERNNPNRNIVFDGNETEFTLRRNSTGHYIAPGTINGYPVVFLLDTGATHIAVPARLGEKLGLSAGRAGEVQTANGTVTIRYTIIPELVFGPFTIKNIEAGLNPGMDDHDEILLGMNVLKHFEFTQRGDVLILRPHHAEQ